MLIGRIIGSAVSTAKDPSLTGHKLLLVREADETGTSSGPVFVAVDGVGRGHGGAGAGGARERRAAQRRRPATSPSTPS